MMGKRKQTFDYNFQYVIDTETVDSIGRGKQFKTRDLGKAKKEWERLFGGKFEKGSSYYVDYYGCVKANIYVEPYDPKLSLKAEKDITGRDPFADYI